MWQRVRCIPQKRCVVFAIALAGGLEGLDVLCIVRVGAAPFSCEGSGIEASRNVAQCHLGEIV